MYGSSETPKPNFLEIATLAIGRGLRVVPLRPGEKSPFLEAWQDKASCDPAQIKKWSDEHPHANCGCVTHPKLVSSILGHSRVQLALDTYDLASTEELTAPLARISKELNPNEPKSQSVA